MPNKKRKQPGSVFTPLRKYTGPADLPPGVQVENGLFVVDPDAPAPEHEPADSMFDGRMHRATDYVDKSYKAVAPTDKAACTLKRTKCLRDRRCPSAGLSPLS